jgi:hypothetical protein
MNPSTPRGATPTFTLCDLNDNSGEADITQPALGLQGPPVGHRSAHDRRRRLTAHSMGSRTPLPLSCWDRSVSLRLTTLMPGEMPPLRTNRPRFKPMVKCRCAIARTEGEADSKPSAWSTCITMGQSPKCCLVGSRTKAV